MTVNVGYTPLAYAGNGATVAFPVTWPFLETSHLVVTATTAGVDTVLTLGTHYTATRTATGGTVNAVTAPATGTTWTITRATPQTQPSTLRTGGSYDPATVEEMVDRCVMQIQEAGLGGGGVTPGGPNAAANVSIADVDGHYIATNVEDALDELYELVQLLVGSGGTPSAAVVAILDAAGYFTSGNVEGALAEIGASLADKAPLAASYLVLAATTGLSAERVLTAGTNISFTDGGPGGPLTINATPGSTSGAASAITFSDTLTGAQNTSSLQELLAMDGVVNVLRFIPEASHAGIKAGTNTDDLSTFINLAFDSGAKGIYFPRGTYHGKNLTFFSGQTIFGDGYNSEIKLHAGAATTDTLLRNYAIGAGGVSNVVISNLRFNGNNNGASTVVLRPRATELISLGTSSSITLRDCWVHNLQYCGVAVGGCTNVTIENCEFYDLGWDSTGPMGSSAEGGPALNVTISGGAQSYDVKVRNNRFYNLRWSGLYFSANSGHIVGNRFRDVREGALFMSRLVGAGILGERVIVALNHVEGVRRAHISSSGFEIGTHNTLICHNYIEDVAHNAIALTDVQAAIVCDNFLYDFGKQNGAGVGALAGSDAQGCGVAIITQTAAPDQPKDIFIYRNRIKDRQGTVTGWAAVGFGGGGGAGTPEYVRIEDNQVFGWTPRSGEVVRWQTYRGTGCRATRNYGTTDEHAMASVRFTVAPSIASATDSLVLFDTEVVDNDGLWSAANPSRFTIPQGWSKVRLTAQVLFQANAAGIRQLRLLRNGITGGVPGMPNVVHQPTSAAFDWPVHFASGPIEVAAGDYFELRVRQESGGALTLTTGAANTWFTIERLA